MTNIHAASNAAIAKAMASSKADAPKASTNAPGVLKRTNAFFVDPKTINRKEGHNPRFDFGEIDDLAASIKEHKNSDGAAAGHGLINDLRVMRIPKTDPDAAKGTFWLIDGDRRFTAIEQLLKAGEVFEFGIPAKIDGDKTTKIQMLVEMFVANGSKPFLPMEEAMAYQTMRDEGMTIQQICKAVGRKQVHVVATMALIAADVEVQDAVKSGAVNSTTAKKIAQHARGDKAKQKELVAKAKLVGKDKTKKAALDKEIDDARRAKAAKTGKVLKMRALTDVELSKIGADLANAMADKMRDAGKALDFDLRDWVQKDDALALAFTFGALEALKAAAGMIIKLDV
jgi:ParB-like chromosome segregation protein Spo0J